MCLDQRWAIIFPERPHWVLEFHEQASQAVRETNPPNEDRKVTKNCAGCTADRKNNLKSLQISPTMDG